MVCFSGLSTRRNELKTTQYGNQGGFQQLPDGFLGKMKRQKVGDCQQFSTQGQPPSISKNMNQNHVQKDNNGVNQIRQWLVIQPQTNGQDNACRSAAKGRILDPLVIILLPRVTVLLPRRFALGFWFVFGKGGRATCVFDLVVFVITIVIVVNDLLALFLVDGCHNIVGKGDCFGFQLFWYLCICVFLGCC